MENNDYLNIQTNQYPSQTQETMSTLPKNTNKNIFKPLFYIFFILFLISISYITYINLENSDLKKALNNQNINNNQSNNINNKIDNQETKEKKTAIYKNIQYKYSINYDDTLWKFIPFDDDAERIGGKLILSGSENEAEVPFIYIFVNERKTEEEKNMTFEEYVKTKNAFKDRNEYETLYEIEKMITENGQTFYIATWAGRDSTDRKILFNPIAYLELKNENMDTVHITLENIKYLNEFKELISTFKTF